MKITSAMEHRAALREIGRLIEDTSTRGESRRGKRLRTLATAVSRYEDTAYPIEGPTLVEALVFRMGQSGFEPEEIRRYFASAFPLLLGEAKRALGDSGTAVPKPP